MGQFRFHILAFLAGVATTMLLAYGADAFVRKGAALLAPPVRERCYQRRMRWEILLRVMDGAGITAMLAGLTMWLGILSIGYYTYRVGLYCAAGGITLLCLERALHGWIRWEAFASEAEAAPVRRRSLVAAVVVSAAELGLAACVVTFALTRQWIDEGPSPEQGSAKVRPKRPLLETGPVETKPPVTLSVEAGLISRSEALELLGRDVEYLDLLVEDQEVKTVEVGGYILYSRAALEKLKQSGLPTLVELKARAAKRASEIVPLHIPPQTRADDVLKE